MGNTARHDRRGGVVEDLTAAMGDNPKVFTVLLTCTDTTSRERLGQREIGSVLAQHLESSAHMDTRLRRGTTATTHQVPTVSDIAAEIIGLTDWLNLPTRS
jgi:hypothetical protein